VGEVTIYVIDDWDAFMEAVSGCRYRLYQLKRIDNTVLVRARAGSIGFERKLDLSDEEDKKLYEKIKRDLEVWNFIEVKKTVADDEFFV